MFETETGLSQQVVQLHIRDSKVFCLMQSLRTTSEEPCFVVKISQRHFNAMLDKLEAQLMP